MTLGDIIKDYRKEHSMSMDSFSEKSGISKAYISLLEKNKHPKTGKPIAPSLQCIRQAAEGMRMDFNDLFALLDGNVTLMEDNSTNTEDKHYYMNNETREMAQTIYENKDLSLLFDAAKDATPEDLKTVHTMLLALKRKEKGE